MMEISTYNSRKIAILNVLAIMLVLLLHSYYLEAADYSVAQSIQKFTGTLGLSGVAVPLFYFISGLLFFKSINRIKDCFLGIRKRIRSLLIPYIIWNLIFVGWYVVLAFTPGVSRFVNSDMMSHFSVSHPMDSLEYLLIEPAGFHLWFLRDLMIYAVCTPLLYFLLRRYPWITLLLLFCVFGRITRCGITYFAMGGIISLHFSLEKFSSWLSRAVVIACVVLFLINAIMATMSAYSNVVGNPYCQQIANTAGILAIWGLYDIKHNIDGHCKFADVMMFVSKYSFFIYLFHEPAFNIIKKLSLRAVGINDWSLITLYLFNPFLMTLFAIAVAIVIKKLLPKTYAVIVGGR